MDYANGKKAVPNDRLVNRRAALSINERVSAYVKSLVANRLRSGKTTGDSFMRRAKTVLPRELFESILKDAQLEHSGANVKIVNKGELE
jgi:hypothetical protein